MSTRRQPRSPHPNSPDPLIRSPRHPHGFSFRYFRKSIGGFSPQPRHDALPFAPHKGTLGSSYTASPHPLYRLDSRHRSLPSRLRFHHHPHFVRKHPQSSSPTLRVHRHLRTPTPTMDRDHRGPMRGHSQRIKSLSMPRINPIHRPSRQPTSTLRPRNPPSPPYPLTPSKKSRTRSSCRVRTSIQRTICSLLDYRSTRRTQPALSGVCRRTPPTSNRTPPHQCRDFSSRRNPRRRPRFS